MNPWGLLVILLGIILVIIGVKGSQHNIVYAITGHASSAGNTGNTGTITGSPSGSSGTSTKPSEPTVTSPPVS